MNPLKKPSSFEEQLKKQLDGSEWKPSDALWDRIEQNIQANSFEPKLQEKLVDYAVSPSEEVWGKVAAQLPDSPKRKGLLWYGGFAVMVLFSFGVGYWINQITSNSQRQLANSQNQLANSSPVNVNPNQQATSAQTDAAIPLQASQANKAINKSKSTASQQEVPAMQEQAILQNLWLNLLQRRNIRNVLLRNLIASKFWVEPIRKPTRLVLSKQVETQIKG